ncbi:MAG: ATP-dependent Clp protease adaptor ClpS [Flavobacteriales bacterium Tduv]
MNKTFIQADRIKEFEKITEEKTEKGRRITVYNDDFNIFKSVIQPLIEVYDHNPDQAEQCTWLIHFKEKSKVKRGTREKVYPMYKILLPRRLKLDMS